MQRFGATMILVVLLTVATPAVWAQDDGAPPDGQARPGPNIALGRPYTLTPNPNYAHCTDPDDAVQLTDGEYSEGHFWVQKSTVGWQRANPIVITVDLGEVKPIRGASFNTAAGAAGVTWPFSIYVLVAGEDKIFREAGDLVALSAVRGLPPPTGYRVHRFWTDALRTHGRYVAFVFAADPYGFVDEVEVYEGEPDWLALTLEGRPIDDIKAHMAGMAVRAGVSRQIVMDIQGIRAKIDDALPADVRQAVAAELDAAESDLGALPADYPPDFRAILPFNPLHERVFRAQARLWQARGVPPVAIWQSNLWDRLDLLADPPAAAAPAIETRLMRNEYRAASLNISNAALDPLTLALRVEGLPGGVNPDYVTVHEVAWTGTKAGVPVAAALPEAALEEGAYRIHVPAGMTRQVWFTFHAKEVPPGSHYGAVRLQGAGTEFRAPLTLTVSPVQFPDRPTLHFGGWDYTDGQGHRGVTPENMDALIRHMAERYVDSPWATSAVMPAGAYDDNGAMVAEPDTTRFDEWIARWPDARQYMVFSAVGPRFARWAMDAPEFPVAVGAWTRFWAAHFERRGIAPDRVALLLVDEPHQPEQDAIILAWARAIRAMDTGIRIWEDPIYRDDMSQADPEMIAACHALCPNRPIFVNAPQAYRDYFVARRDEGIALEFYSCSGPVRALDPYSYHRLQAWSCLKYDAKATYFWAFGDNGGGSSWNEYIAPGTDYCPMFLDNHSVTAGKHMEACRESIQDFEYFVMLRAALDADPRTNRNDAVSARGRALLEEGPSRVLDASGDGSFWWRHDIDRTLADQVRLEVLDVLEAMSP